VYQVLNWERNIDLLKSSTENKIKIQQNLMVLNKNVENKWKIKKFLKLDIIKKKWNKCCIYLFI